MSVKSRRHYDIERNVRDKIEVIKLLNRLQEHALGDSEIMTASQISAAAICLKKALPDLTESHVFKHEDVAEMTDQQILERLAELRAQASGASLEATIDPSQLN